MPWVRSHYRRPRRAKGDASGCLGILLLGGVALVAGPVIAALVAIAAVVSAGAQWVQENWVALTVVATLVGAAFGVAALMRWQKARRLSRFMSAARALASDPHADTSASMVLGAQRPRELGQAATVELEGMYRAAVADVLTDRVLDNSERGRLDRLAPALGVGEETARRAELEAFLQIYTAAVEDRALTEKEESQLAHLKDALRVSEAAVQQELEYVSRLRDHRLALQDQMRRAKAIREGQVAPIAPSVKLRGGETCFLAAPFTEKKQTTVRTYVQDGVRRKETAMERVRAGDMYVTDQRVLLVADGTTTIKTDKILDTAIDTAAGHLVLTVDGRKTPYYFEVAEPYVALAHIDRVVRAEGGGDPGP